MSSPAANPNNFCYRHPDRQSFVLCQRCGRTICPECQNQAAVGVHCPECVAEHAKTARRPKSRAAITWDRARRGEGPVATYSIMAVTAVVYLAQLLTGGWVIQNFAYAGVFTAIEPWRMLTSMFVHSQNSFFHILFNMYALWIFGRILETMLGRWRFLALWFLSGLAGSVAVLLISPTVFVVGASGGVFGLLAAMLVIQRGLGANATQLLVVLGLNLVIGFVVPGIAWEAHLGGAIVGALIAFVYMRTRSRFQLRRQRMLVLAVGAGLIVLTVAGYLLMAARFF